MPEEPEAHTHATAGAATPRVWLLLGEKRGDNAQVRSLAASAGWPAAGIVEKHVAVAERWQQVKPPVRASLAHLDVAGSEPLEPPWPDLVLTAGRRLASVGLWIKQRSGARTKLAVIGKPRGRRRDFDLIIAASHYVLPDAPNVARHDYPLMDVDRDVLAAAARAAEPSLSPLPRPLVALMVGGPTGGLRLDEPVAQDVLEQSAAWAARERGTLYVVTSRRTPPAVRDALRAALPEGARLHAYDQAGPDAPNPYHALLASAEGFVVTSDSASMLVEIARLGRPLSIAPLARSRGPLERGLEAAGLLAPLDPRRDPIPAGGVAARTLAALGWPIHSRDLTALSRRLVATGHAAWLGDPPVAPAGPLVDEALPRVIERVRALVTQGRSTRGPDSERDDGTWSASGARGL